MSCEFGRRMDLRKRAKEMPKLMNEKTANVEVDLEKSVMRGLDELKQEVNRAIQHRTPDNEDVTRQIVDDHVVDIYKGDKLMDGKLGEVDDLEKTVMGETQKLEQTLNQELLNLGTEKEESRERAGEPLSHTEKKSKLLEEDAMNVNVNIEKASATQIQKLEQALDRNDDDPRIQCLVQEIAKTPDLPPNLTMRLLKFCVKVGDRDVARRLLDHQTVDVNTREGGELLWTALEKDEDEIAAMLVRHGADLSVRKFNEECTILHHMVKCYKTAYNAGRQELFRLMLEHGADVNARDNKGRSVLNVAVVNAYQSHRWVEELVKHGAQVTIDRADRRLDDLSYACRYDLELLPVLIRVDDEEVRNERAIVAIEYLIMRDFTGEEKGLEIEAAIEMIGRILDFGVNVNVSTNPSSTQLKELRYSLLDKALWFKNKEVVKLLLDHGADPHQRGMFGYTPLYRATSFKGYTHVTRWLIEKGASLHERNDDGRYPIHGACENESLRNIHLFLNLGADLNATDSSGKTPFDLMKMRETLKCKEAHHLVIKHFALMIAQGGKISDRDMNRVNQCDWSRHHFEKCSEQLDKMKEVKVFGDVPYFALLSKNMYRKTQLMKNKNFLEKFKKDEKRRAELFPDYFYMIIHSAEIAEKKLKMLIAEKEQLRESFPEATPDHILEKIAYYLSFEKLERCQHEYFMSFHAALKYNQTDKKKIL